VIILDTDRSVGRDDRSAIFELDLIDIPSTAPASLSNGSIVNSSSCPGFRALLNQPLWGRCAWRAALKIPQLRSAIALENDERVEPHVSKLLHSPNFVQVGHVHKLFKEQSRIEIGAVSLFRAMSDFREGGGCSATMK
jgi:hypothetical protein